MKACPKCGPLSAPVWCYAREVSKRDGVETFIPCGCQHVVQWHGYPPPLVKQADREAFEAKWDAEMERHFADYTVRWTEEQRERYRKELWPQPFKDALKDLISPPAGGTTQQ